MFVSVACASPAGSIVQISIVCLINADNCICDTR